MFSLSTTYWVAVWVLMGLTVIAIWLAVIFGSLSLDKQKQE